MDEGVRGPTRDLIFNIITPFSSPARPTEILYIHTRRPQPVDNSQWSVRRGPAGNHRSPLDVDLRPDLQVDRVRLNPIAAARDWSAKKKMKAHLLSALKGTAPGTGVEVPRDDPRWAVALMELVVEKPGLTVVRLNNSMMLARRAEMGGLSRELRGAMEDMGALVTDPRQLLDDGGVE